MGNSVNIIVNGKTIAVPEEDLQTALDQNPGAVLETSMDKYGRLTQERLEEEHGGTFDKYVTAPLAGAARGLTLGGSDVLFDALGEGATFRGLRDVNPTASTVGEIGGAVLGAAFSGGGTLAARMPAAAAASVGARVARAGEGAGALARIGRGAAGGAVEGGIQGAGAGVSDLALSDKPLTLEHVVSSLSSNALFGAGAGGVVGAGAKGFEVGLGRAKRAMDDFRARGEAADALPDDLANMDVKQLRAARELELDSIKTARAAETETIKQARVAEKQSIADELGAHHTAMDSEKAWLATKDSTDREVRIIGKQLWNANKPLRNMLDNPKYLAEKPQQALAHLQKQEHALEEILRVDGRLRRTFAAGDDEVVEAATTASGKVRPAKDLPEGWDPDAVVDGGKLFDGRPTLHEGVPAYRSLAKRAERENAYIVRPSDLGNRKLVGIQSGDDMLADARTVGFRQSLEGGAAKLPAVEIQVAKDGTYFVADGNHRMLGAALAGDKPMLVRFKRTAQDASGMDPIGDQLKAALAQAPKRTSANTGARAAALDTVPTALERNRALQARIREATSEIKLTTPDVSPRLQQIDEARELLSAGRGEKSIAEQALQGSVFSGVTGAASMIPVVGPFVAPLIGAKASKLVGEAVFGNVGRVSAETARRASRAIDALLSASTKVSRIAPPLASKTLAAIRYAPPEEGAKPLPKRKPDLATLYHERSKELRSQTMYAADGSIQMRPEARAAVAGRLDPIRAVDPIAADKLETIAARRVEFLASKLPRRPDIGGMPLSASDRWRPSEMEMRQFARYAAAVEDPMGIVERVSDGTVTPSDTEVMKAVYPEMYADIASQIVARLPEMRTSLPYRQRLALSRFTGEPIDASMHPRILAVLQAQHAQEPGSQGGTQAPTPQPKFSAFGSPSKRGGEIATPSQRRSVPA